MSVREASDVAIDDTLTADICVIGGGAAGITLARCLDGSSRQVLLLEAGGVEHDAAAEADSFQVEHTGVPHHNPIPSRGRWLGGATNLWFGRIAVPDAIDFAERSWVPHSGWPLSLDALDPWLVSAATILDVAHHDRFDIGRWSSHPTIETFRRDGETDLDVFFWSGAQDMAKAARSILERSPNVTTITDATVNELVTDGGRVTSVSVVGPGRRPFKVTAAQFVLAAGGLENPRLLLASTGSSETGVGNEHDNVGRYYLDHPRGEGLARVDLRGLSPSQLGTLALLDERADSEFGTTQLRVVFSEELQRSEQLLNHGLHGHLVADAQKSEGFEGYKRMRDRVRRRQFDDRRAIAGDIASIVRGAPQLTRFGFDRVRGRSTPTEFVVIDQMEHEPDPESRVTVNPRNLDRFGLPRVTVHWRINDSTRRSQRRMHELFRDALERVGITGFSSDVLDRPDDELELIDMKHPSGTTRMSASPKDGVVDPNCRVHGVDNLYVVGSSTFPTTGHFNPTLLIVALAARLADHLVGLAD